MAGCGKCINVIVRMWYKNQYHCKGVVHDQFHCKGVVHVSMSP